MAALSIESLFHNKSSFQIAIRAIQLLLLSTGSVSTFLMFKEAVFPYSYDLMLSTLRKPLCYFRSWMSSPLYIYITINFIVILIAVSSLFHHQRMDNNGDIEDGGDSEDYDLHSSALSPSLSPPPAPPPMQNNHQKQVQYSQEPEPKPKDIMVVAASLKSHIDTNPDANDVDKVGIESFQGVFSDFYRLTEAKEIKKAPTRKAGVKIKTATASLKIQQDTHDDTNVIDESLQVVFSDYPELTEAKEIKKANSLDSASQVLPIQKTKKTMTTKNGHETIKGRQNQLRQTKQQLENEDDEEDDTMEATWRLITGEGTIPQKQLKKSDTWPQSQSLVAAQEQNNDLEEDMSESAAAWKELTKSMTFNDTVSIRCRGGLTRDPSMNLEEFNQRVDTFIKNFNNELRLQRQESEQRCLDMITCGL